MWQRIKNFFKSSSPRKYSSSNGFIDWLFDEWDKQDAIDEDLRLKKLAEEVKHKDGVYR